MSIKLCGETRNYFRRVVVSCLSFSSSTYSVIEQIVRWYLPSEVTAAIIGQAVSSQMFPIIVVEFSIAAFLPGKTKR